MAKVMPAHLDVAVPRSRRQLIALAGDEALNREIAFRVGGDFLRLAFRFLRRSPILE